MDGPEVIAGFQEVGGEGVAEGGKIGGEGRPLDGYPPKLPRVGIWVIMGPRVCSSKRP